MIKKNFPSIHALKQCLSQSICQLVLFFLLVYDNPEIHRICPFFDERLSKSESEDTHGTHFQPKPSSFDQLPPSCLYAQNENRATLVEQAQPNQSCDVRLGSRKNELRAKTGAKVAGDRDPKVLTQYENFPPNKTIGPEMKVVIPHIPTQNNFRLSPQNNGGQMQYAQLRATDMCHFSPSQTTETQEVTDSDSEWKNKTLVDFGGFM